MYFLQTNEIVVDTSAGLHQEYVEDCQVCCRPQMLVVDIDRALRGAVVSVERA